MCHSWARSMPLAGGPIFFCSMAFSGFEGEEGRVADEDWRTSCPVASMAMGSAAAGRKGGVWVLRNWRKEDFGR